MARALVSAMAEAAAKAVTREENACFMCTQCSRGRLPSM
jgi:hypothetical protein